VSTSSKSAQNVPDRAKPRGKPFQPGDDPRRGKNGGKSKNEHSITYWINEFGNMTPNEVADLCDTFSIELRKGGKKMSFYGIIAIRWLMDQANGVDPRLLELLLDRTEGKVPNKLILDDWRKDAAELGVSEEVAQFEAAVVAKAAAKARGD
jgi:hypothetical protein